MVSRGCEFVAVVEWQKMSLGGLRLRVLDQTRSKRLENCAAGLRGCRDIEIMFRATSGHQIYMM